MRRKLPYLALSLLLHALALLVIPFIFPARLQPPGRAIDVTLIRIPQPFIAEAQNEAKEPRVQPPHAARTPGQNKKTSVAAQAAPQKEQRPIEESVMPQQPQPLKTETAPPEKSNMFVLSYGVLSRSVKEQPGCEKEPSGPDKALADFFGDFKAKQKVEDGGVDPMFIKLKNGLEERWSPGFDQVEVDSFKKTIAKWLKQYQKSAETFGKTGSTGDKSPAKDHEDYEIVNKNGQGDGILESYGEVQKSGAWTTSVQLVVDLDFDGKGGWKLAIHRPSGHPRFDEEAARDLEHALESKELQLPDVAVKTRWALEADFTILPLLPVAGINFDFVLKQFNTAYPLKKKISKRIRLLAVKP